MTTEIRAIAERVEPPVPPLDIYVVCSLHRTRNVWRATDTAVSPEKAMKKADARRRWVRMSYIAHIHNRPTPTPDASAARIAELEKALSAVREYAKSVVDRQDAKSNEEYNAASDRSNAAYMATPWRAIAGGGE